VLVRVAPWDALGSALKEDVRVSLAVLTMALPGDTRYAPGAGAIKAKNPTRIRRSSESRADLLPECASEVAVQPGATQQRVRAGEAVAFECLGMHGHTSVSRNKGSRGWF
jgi:hypothetical protein